MCDALTHAPFWPAGTLGLVSVRMREMRWGMKHRGARLALVSESHGRSSYFIESKSEMGMGPTLTNFAIIILAAAYASHHHSL